MLGIYYDHLYAYKQLRKCVSVKYIKVLWELLRSLLNHAKSILY